MKYRFPGMNRTNSLDDLPTCGVLQKIAGCTSIQKTEHVAVIVVSAEDQHGSGRIGLLDLLSGLNAVQPRHDDVHQHDVGLQGPDRCYSLVPVACLPHHRYVTLLLQEIPHALPQHRMVVRQHYSDCFHGLSTNSVVNSFTTSLHLLTPPVTGLWS